jgi:hypothetical protein
MCAQYNKMANCFAKKFSVGTNVLVHNVRGKAARAVVVDARAHTWWSFLTGHACIVTESF